MLTFLLTISVTSFIAVGFHIFMLIPFIEPEMSRAKDRDSISHCGNGSNIGVVAEVLGVEVVAMAEEDEGKVVVDADGEEKDEVVVLVVLENDDSFSAQVPSQQQNSPLSFGYLWQSPFLYSSDSYSQHPQSLKIIILI